MECLGCNLIEEKPVTLKCGKTVCSSCEEWRHECEVRHVAALESNERRKEYLEDIRKIRGEANYARLRLDVWNLLQGIAA